MTISIVRPRLGAVITFLACVVFLSGCATITTGSHYDETTNFGSYRTFAWIDEMPYISDATAIRVSPLTQSKIQQAIRNQLEQKGYAFTEDRESADFVVAYTVGARDKIRVTSYPIGFHGSWGWHIHGSYYYVREYQEHAYTEGTLGVDIFDGRSKKPIWHGWAQKTITESDRKDPSSAINEGVAKLFHSYPR